MLAQHDCGTRPPKLQLPVFTRVRLTAVVRLPTRVAIPKPRRNGDESAHALADERAVGQPIELLLTGWPNVRVGYWAAKIFPLLALTCHLPITSRLLPAYFFRVRYRCSPTGNRGCSLSTYATLPVLLGTRQPYSSREDARNPVS